MLPWRCDWNEQPLRGSIAPDPRQKSSPPRSKPHVRASPERRPRTPRRHGARCGAPRAAPARGFQDAACDGRRGKERKSVVKGKRVSVRVDRGGGRINKKKKNKQQHRREEPEN